MTMSTSKFLPLLKFSIVGKYIILNKQTGISSKIFVKQMSKGIGADGGG